MMRMGHKGLGFGRKGAASLSKGGWSPLKLGNKLLAWWDASYGITLSGNQVTAWADRKSGYSATQGVSSARPTWSTSAFNGYPGLVFDGNDDELTATESSLLAALPSGASPSELWAVAQQDALIGDTSTRTLVGYGDTLNTSRQLRRQVISSGTVHQLFAIVGTGGGSVSASETPADATGRKLLRGEFTATTLAFTLDGGARRISAAVPSTTASRLRIGSLTNPAAGTFWLGKIRDVLVTLPLSADEAAKLQSFLLSRRAL